MVNSDKTDVTITLDEHVRSIDTLHQKLAAAPGVDQNRLRQAVEKYKAATKSFQDDALACMN